MIKKITSLFLSVLILFSFSSCKEGNSENSPDFGASEYTLELKTEIITEGGCRATLIYPVLGGVPDAENANRRLRDNALDEYRMKSLSTDGDKTVYYDTESAYISLKSGKFFSAYFCGRISAQGANHDDFFSYTVNLNVETGMFIDPTEFISDFSRLKECFVSGSFRRDFGDERLDSDITPEAIFSQYRYDYGIYPDIYFKQNSFAILAPVLYIYGGYAGYEIGYSEAKEFLKTDSPLFEGAFSASGE